MPASLLRFALVAIFCLSLQARSTPSWTLAQSPHFEIYAQGDPAAAQAAVQRFEQLRAFFVQQTGLLLDHPTRLRVIAFSSAQEYEPYRLSATADAYYVGTNARETIVLPTFAAASFGIAGHEYTHSVLRAGGIQLPHWLSEGLAEFFSTARISERTSTIGGRLTGRVQVLRARTWLPLVQLLPLAAESALLAQRSPADMFYAESWALTDMLIHSPQYQPRFPALIAALATGTPGTAALPAVYGRSLDQLSHDLYTWVNNDLFTATQLPGVAKEAVTIQTSAVTPFAAHSLLAELLLATGKVSLAAARYRELAQESPDSPDIAAALGTIALREGDLTGARQHWRQAIHNGVQNARLCLQYAQLAQAAGEPEETIRAALTRALALDPRFEDARYGLAMLESNTGHYEAALAALQALRHIPPQRRYHYWSAIAYAHNELGHREEARAAARRAATFATTADERTHAHQLDWIAQSEVAVQLSFDAHGQPQGNTTRIPVKTARWNPFVGPGDQIRRLAATLQEIDCSDRVIRLHVNAAGEALTLSLPDPSHVQVLHGPTEWTCGPQSASPVTVEFAKSGLLRGIDFAPDAPVVP